MTQCGLGGRRWRRQFISGSDLVGKLNQEGVFPMDSRTAHRRPEPTHKLFESASARFKERPAASGRKNGKILCEEALEQVEKGRIEPPTIVPSSSSSTRASPVNYAFRFGVAHGAKLRACDDLMQPRTNLSCAIATPVNLAPRGHVSEICRRARPSKGEWRFTKADHEAAFKQLPLREEHSRLAAVFLRNPADGCWYSFRSRALLFGAAAAVLQYNVFSRIADELFTRLFGIPFLSFLDDFGAFAPSSLSQKALGAFADFWKLLWITLKAEKADVCPMVAFLRMRGFSSCRDNAMKLHISLTEEKASQWSELIRTYRMRGPIRALELESLIGKSVFSQTCLFGKFARTKMRYLYKKIHRRYYASSFSAMELSFLL